MWANEFDTGANDPNFDNEYLTNEVIARAIVNRAIADWNEVITSFNYAEDADTNPNNDLDDEF